MRRLITMRKMSRGFSLIELLLVVVILAILAAVVLPNVLGRSDEAKIEAAKTDIGSIKTAVKLFRLDNGRYPSNEEGISALVTQAPTAKTWKEPYLEKMPKDPWGHEYHYESQAPKSSMGYDISSDGPDGMKDTDDDIKSWEDKK